MLVSKKKGNTEMNKKCQEWKGDVPQRNEQEVEKVAKLANNANQSTTPSQQRHTLTCSGTSQLAQ